MVKNNRVVLLISTLLIAVTSLPVLANNSGITYQGRIVLPNGQPETDTAVQFKFQIRTPGASNCLMYEELQTLNMASSKGVFALSIDDGSGVRDDSSGYTLQQIFANRGTFTFNSSACSASNSYTPNSVDGRVLQVYFKDSTLSAWESVPAENISSIPMAIESEQVGGYAPASLLRFQESDGTLDSVSPLNNAQYASLVALANGTSGLYLKSGTGGAMIPSVTAAPASPIAGSLWFNSTTGSLQYEGTSGVQTIGTSGGSVTSIATGPALTGGPITTTGTIDLATLGPGGTGTKLTFDTYGRVTSSASLTGSDIPTLTMAGQVSGSAITSGTISGSTSINTTGNITTTGTSAALNTTATNGSFNDLLISKADNSNKVTITASNSQSTNYGLVLPLTAGAPGQLLATDGGGNLSWTTAASGSVTSVTSTLPLTSSGGSTPNLSLAQATGNANGYLSSADWTNFNGKLTASLISGQIFIGNNSNVATAVTPAGDVTISNTGATLVGKIQGTNISSTTPLDGQYLKYAAAGVNYAPAYANFSDLKSSAGLTQIPNTCTSAQTLAYQSPSDTFACTAIAISDSAVTYGSKAANTFFAAPNGSIGAPSFRTIATADLGTGAPSALNYLRGDGTWAALPSSAAAGTSGQVQFNNANVFAASGNLFWDNTNSRLGIGTASPAQALDVKGALQMDGSTSGFAGFQAPAVMTTSQIWTLPAADGGNGQLLSTNGAGVLTWTTPAGPGISALSSDVSASGTGSVVATVNSVGGSTAALVHSAELAANAATNTNTVSTIVKRDASGNFAASAATLASAVFRDSSSNTVTLQAPTTVSSSYALRWPTSVAASAGLVLSSDTSGNLSWISPSTGTQTFSGPDTFSGDVTMSGSGTGLAIATTTASTSPSSGAFTVAGGMGVAGAANVGTSLTSPIIYGSNLANGTLTLDGTSNATPGSILMNPIGGSVGIGTTTPATLFDIEGGTATIDTATATISPTSFSSPAVGAYLQLGTNASKVNDAITASGGTLSWTSLLSVANSNLTATNTSVTTTNAASLFVKGGMRANTNETISNSYGIYVYGGNTASGGSVTNSYGLFVNGQSGGTNNYGAVFTGGNVGIGTTAPGSPLTVNGVIQSTSGGIKFPDGTTQSTSASASAWSSYTPTITASSGTLGGSTVVARYSQIGKTITFTMVITITSLGSASGVINATLPTVPNSTAIVAGRENAVTGSMLQGVITSGNQTMPIWTYNNGGTTGSGYILIVSGSYESQ